MTMDGPDFVFTLNDQIRVIARRVGKLFYIDLYDLKEMFAKDKVGIVHKVHNVVKTDGREGFTYFHNLTHMNKATYERLFQLRLITGLKYKPIRDPIHQCEHCIRANCVVNRI